MREEGGERWMWSQIIRLRQTSPRPKTIAHSEEEREKEIDLNVLSRDAPAAVRWSILHEQDMFNV